MAKYEHRVTCQRNKLIRPRALKRGDLVLQWTFDKGKLKPNWEGSFIVVDDESKGACRLQSPYGKTEPRPWNSAYQKKYFQ